MRMGIFAKRGFALLLTLALTASLWGGGLATHAADIPHEADNPASDFVSEVNAGPAEDAGPEDMDAGDAAPDAVDAAAEAAAEEAGMAAAGYTLYALLAAARQSGASAAEMLNVTGDESAHQAGLEAVLDLYYGEALYGPLEAFAAAISERAEETLARYAEARAEREAERPAYVPGEVLVVFRPEVSEAAAEAVLAEQEAAVIEELLPEAPEVAVVAEIPLGQTVTEAVKLLDADPAVEFAQPNYLYYPEELEPEATNDPRAGQQWHLPYINQAAAWELLDGLEGPRDPVVVAVIDTPVDMTHNDLQANLLQNHARNFVGYGTTATITDTDGIPYDEPDTTVRADWQYYWTTDPGTHGTHVAGIVGAVANNSVGVIGVGSGSSNQLVRIMPLNVFRYGLAEDVTEGTPTYQGAASTHVEAAVSYARRNGAKVINLSLGGEYNNDFYMQRGINTAVAAGITVVAAAGNTNKEWLQDTGNTGRYQPSDFDNVISVINLIKPATQSYQQDGVDVRSGTSNYGGKDIAAPGAVIYSTYPGNRYSTSSGTSMAAPIVSAVAAMLYYADPGITPAKVRSILQGTAIDVYKKGYDSQTAWGCVNAEAAVRVALRAPERLTVQPADESVALALTWDAVTDAVSYEIARKGGADTDFRAIGTVTTPGFTDATAARGNIYTYRVRAQFSQQGQAAYGAWSAPADGALILAAPTDFDATNAAGGDIVLSWQPNNGASGYHIVRYSGSTEDKTFEVAGGDTGSFTDPGTTSADLGKAYSYRISAWRQVAGDEPLPGELSAAVNATRRAPAPQNLTTTPGSSVAVFLRWDEVPGTNFYVLQRSVDGGPYTELATVTEGTYYTDNTCTAASLYSYRVLSRATRTGTVNSAWSESCAGYTILSAPALKSATPQESGTVALSWNTVVGAQYYEVWRSVQNSDGAWGSEELIATVTGASYLDDDRNLPLDLTVGYRLRAAREVNAQTHQTQESAFSAKVTAVPSFPAPTPQVVSSHPGALKISWTATPGADGYHIYRAILTPAGSAATDEKVATVTGTSFTDVGFWQLAEYRYTIIPYATRPGGERRGQGATLHPPVNLEGLTGLRATLVAGDEITLTWKGLDGHPCLADLGYLLTRTGPGGTVTQIGPLPATYGNTYTDTGLTVGASYSYTLTAVLAGRESAPSNRLTVETAPAMSTDALRVESAGYDQLRIAWTPVADADGYTVLRATSELGPFTLAALVEDSETATITDIGLATGTAYHYRVHCFVYGEGNARFTSANYSGNPGGTSPAPAAVTLSAEAPAGTGGTVQLSWSAVAGASGYSLYRLVAGEAVWQRDVKASVRSLTLTGLEGEDQFYFVRAWRTVGKTKIPGADSNTVRAEPNTLPAVDAAAFRAALLAGSSDTVRVVWNGLPGATGYTLYCTAPENLENPARWTAVKTLKAGAEEHLDTGVPAGAWVYIIVPKFKTGGKTFEGAPTATPEPVSVAGSVATVTDLRVSGNGWYTLRVQWNATPGATGYNIYRAPCDDADPAAADYTLVRKHGAATEWVDTATLQGDYAYIVAPVWGKARLEGAPTAPAAGTAPEPGWPASVSQPLTAVRNAGLGALTAEWAPAGDAGGYLLRFESQDGGKTVEKTAKANATSLTVTGLAPGLYTVQLGVTRTHKGKRIVTWQDKAGFHEDVTVEGLAAPAALAATANGYHSTSLSWNEVSATALGTAATPGGYAIYRVLPGEGDEDDEEILLKTVSRKTLTYTDRTAPANHDGSVTEYRVRAYATVGGKRVYGGYAADTVAVTGLEAAGGFTVDPTGPHTATFAWEPVDGASGYLLQRARHEDGPYTTEATIKAKKGTGGMSTTLTNLPDGNWYFRVVPYLTVSGKKLEGAPTDAWLDHIAALPAPAKAAAQADGLFHSLQLTWDRVEGATGYTIYRADDADAPYLPVATAKATKKAEQKLTLKGQPMGSGHYMVVPTRTVKKVTFTGTGRLFRFEGTATAVRGLDAPVGVSAEPSGLMGVKVSWGRVSGASGYYVYEVATATASDIGTSTANDIATLRATVSGGGKTSAVVIAPATPNDAGIQRLDTDARARYRVVPYYKHGKLLLPGNAGTTGGEISTAAWAGGQSLESLLRAVATAAITPAGPYTTAIRTEYSGEGLSGVAIRAHSGGAATATDLVKQVKTGRATTTLAYSPATATDFTVALSRTAFGQTVEWTLASTLDRADFEVEVLDAAGGFTVSPAGAGKAGFSWNRVDGATGYYLYRAPSATAAGTRVKTVAQPKTEGAVSVASLGVPKTGEYHYYVVPYVKAGGKIFTGPPSQRVTHAAK